MNLFKIISDWFAGNEGSVSTSFVSTTKNGERLNKSEERFIYKAKCPDCRGGLLEGPHGGYSVNLYCSNGECGSRFNFMGEFGVERITDKQPALTKAHNAS